MPQYTVIHPTLARQPRFLTLKILDYIPYQRKMLNEALISPQEFSVLHDYHFNCVLSLSDDIGTEAGKSWLRAETDKWLY
jgi:C-terminal region of peptidase_M24